MADLTINTPPIEPRRRSVSPSIVLPAALFLALMYAGADFTPRMLTPLKALQIPCPWWLEYSLFLIPGACAGVWLMSFRKWPNAGWIVAVLLCFTLMWLFPQYPESKVAKVRVTRWVDSYDLESMGSRLGVPVWEEGSREATFVVVSPAKEQRVRTELARLKLLGGAAAG
jgi:hypothetical protein